MAWHYIPADDGQDCWMDWKIMQEPTSFSGAEGCIEATTGGRTDTQTEEMPTLAWPSVSYISDS